MKVKKINTKIFRNSERLAIDLIAEILNTNEVVRNKGVFDWLCGDKGTKLRVDAYFPAYNLVVEYHGVQHFKVNKLMDRRTGRAEQRRKYTELRRKLIPKHDLKLLEIKYDEPLTINHLKNRLDKEGFKI
jgi:hypothetical protein